MQIPIAQGVFADLFSTPQAQSLYVNAPLLKERCDYLSYLHNKGVPLSTVRHMASMQINAIKLLNMTQARPIQSKELEEASSRWATEVKFHRRKKPGKASAYNFTHRITKWLTFIDLLVKPAHPKLPLDSLVKRYLEKLRVDGLSESTISQRRYSLSMFQGWMIERRNNVNDVALADVEAYLDSRRSKGWAQPTLHCACKILRLFFRFCESQNCCQAGIARGIVMPRGVKLQTSPRGPAWKDVRRMLKIVGTTPIELRANAVISLASIYALRRSEILQLRITDFDWYNEIMTVRRAKNGRVQRFPIQGEVGEAVLAYLRSARPPSSCPNLFTTFHAPIRPMGPSSIANTVSKRMKTLSIKSQNFGPHALRHSCATQLLDEGFSLHEIADFLGHRGLEAVSTYAKFNPRLLRRVASLSLAGIL